MNRAAGAAVHPPVTDGQPGGQAVAGPYPMGLMAILATVGMLFAAFTAALLVRRASADWVPLSLPRIIWLNTTVLLGSSVAVELARAALRRDGVVDAARWLATGGLLGVLFVAGQVAAWGALAARDVFLSSSPHAAFFYMLSAVHGAHVMGGLGALGFTLRRLRRGAYSSRRHQGLTHATIYWHFVDGTWLYLLALLLAL